MKSLIHIIEGVVEGFGGLARLCVLALVLLVATNVLLRYFFSIGPVSLQEFEWHLISPIALLGLSYSMKHRADVRVDILYDKFSIKKQALVDLITAVATVAIGIRRGRSIRVGIVGLDRRGCFKKEGEQGGEKNVKDEQLAVELLVEG